MNEKTKQYIGDWQHYKAFQQLDELSAELGKLYSIKKIYPAKENIFKAFHFCQPKDLQVVMMSQDPYSSTYVSRKDGSTKCHATGLCFANNFDVPARSPSLKLLYKSIVDCNYMFLDDSMQSIAEQGVLCLNSALTVEHGLSNSHQALWYEFTTDLLTEISERHTGMVYILIGSRAGSFYEAINKNTSNIFTCEHPSRALHEGREWRSEEVWKQANAALWKISKNQIKW